MRHGTSSALHGAATLLHNPLCSKSRTALGLLQSSGIRFETREYLHDPLGADELAALGAALRRAPSEWSRRADPEWPFGDASPDDADCYRALVDEPRLLERPIFLHGGVAIVGRPPELVLALAGAMPNDGARYAVCRMDQHGEYDETLVETPSEEGARRLVAHYREASPDAWSWPEHHMIRRLGAIVRAEAVRK